MRTFEGATRHPFYLCSRNHEQMSRPRYVIENVYNLVDEREARNLSKIALSRLLNIDVKLIYQYEYGILLPLHKNYNKLARFFGWPEWDYKKRYKEHYLND